MTEWRLRTLSGRGEERDIDISGMFVYGIRNVYPEMAMRAGADRSVAPLVADPIDNFGLSKCDMKRRGING